MHRRRQVLLTAASAIATGGIVGLGASSASSSAAASDFRVLVGSRARIELTPANDRPVHVQTNGQGEVTGIVPGDGQRGVSQRAITRFEDVVLLTNNGTPPIVDIRFDFQAAGDALSEQQLARIEDALSVTTDDRTLESGADSGDNLLAVSPHENAENGQLGPGGSVPFGIEVNLNPDAPPGTIEDFPDEDFDVTLGVFAERRGN